ncbi:PAS domain-containing protein [Nannocystis bainbridge]|uniref:histidine kinase n=1 Tax=Nannocystis bainbridge TaxID=2995303 RepID=A0ABT5DZ55_9BACT|nr:PAS domain-containing protein [Nannocystis bainbridge]MDC0717736.1 PAS domain S-box protein [Nannocystis bainbridge]
MPPSLRDLLEDSDEKFAAVDPDGRVLVCSRTLREALGWSEDQVATASLVAAAAPEYRDKVRDLLARVFAGEPDIRGHTVMTARDGRELELYLRMHRAPDGESAWVGAQCELARVHGQIGGILATATGVGLLAVDIAGRIVRFNRGAERLYGLAAEDVLGRHFDVLPSDPDEVAERIRELTQEFGRPATKLDTYTLRAREYGSDEHASTIPRVDGTRAFVEVVTSPLREATGEVIGYVGILRDVTATRLAQAEHERLANRLRGALLASTDSIVVTERVLDEDGDFDLVIVEVNPGTTRLMARPREKLIGLRLSEFGGRRRMSTFLSKYERVFATGETLDEDIRLDTDLMPGVEWLRHQAVRVGDGVAITARDITKRKRSEVQLRNSEQRLSMALEAAGDELWDWDLAAGTVFFTRGDVSRTYSESELAHAVHPDDREAFHEAVRKHMSGETPLFQCEYRALNAKGKPRWVLGRGRLVAHDAVGRPLRLMGTQTDISARRRQEDTLRQAVRAAEAASRAKSEFLAHVSHEIRTPMNGILGMVELALLDDPPPPAPARLRVIQDSARSLLSVINDLLDVTKIEAGKLALAPVPFDLHATMQRTVDALRPRAQEQGLRFAAALAPAVPRWLVGDPDRLRQVLVNLIGNAIKFTAHGEVQVEVSAEVEAERARLRFAVRDTGIGIAPERLTAIFVPFEQGDASTTRRFGGTGLGLTIADRLVRLMGGAIAVDSKVGTGSTFSFAVELACATEPQRAETRPPPAKPSRATRRMRVLLAEDHPINQLVAAEMLRGAGHEVAVVHDGHAALAAASSTRFDLVLMDVQMPGMDGWEAAAEIRKHPDPRVRSVPIVAMTARATEADRLHSLERGMDGFLTKPVQISDLQAVLATIGERPNGAVEDWDAVMKRVAGSHKTLLKMIDMARDEAPKVAEVLRASAVKDPEVMRQAAHRTAGTAALFSAGELLALARELEGVAIQASESERVSRVERLIDAMFRLTDDLVARGRELAREPS